jgi:hypothetical protein
MLAMLLGAEQIAVHSPDDLDWKNLPFGNCVLQLHWRKTSAFKRILIENNFNIIVLQRHPLDVLVSILQFAPQEPQTIHWLNGEGGNEAMIYGQSPVSNAFLEYACGPRARALLSVSAEWSLDPDVILVRYENLVNDTENTLHNILFRLGVNRSNVTDIVALNSIDILRRTSKNGHFWQGKVGMWKKYIPSEMAKVIAMNQSSVSTELEHDELTYESVTIDTAKRYWERLDK